MQTSIHLAIQYKRWLGYRKGEDGKPEIIPEEAKVVKQIFDAHLSGESLRNIKYILESEGIPTKIGLTDWSIPSINKILQNEKYTGNAWLQKTYTVDPISKRQKKNQGELPQYWVKTGILPLSLARHSNLFKKNLPGALRRKSLKLFQRCHLQRQFLPANMLCLELCSAGPVIPYIVAAHGNEVEKLALYGDARTGLKMGQSSA